MARARLALLLALLLSGCSGGGGGDGAAASDPPAGDASGASGTTAATPPAPLPPREIFNDTLDFAARNGGAAGDEGVAVPKGYGNVSIAFRILADCPGGYAANGPGLVAEAGGVQTTVWSYAVLLETEPYTCSVASQFTNRERATGTVVLAAEGGEVRLATVGEFTGEAEVAVTALP